jgi:DNA-binding response OmpR family regulator
LSQNQKILIVDDDPDIRDALIIILESQGYQVDTANYGAEGLKKVAADKPDLMILDLIMPGMGGFAVYKELKNSNRPDWNDIRILILTSLREEASKAKFEEETGMKMAVDDYIEKPISPSLIIERVRKLLNGK